MDAANRPWPYIPPHPGDVCIECGAHAEHICVNGRFPSCFACTAEWYNEVLYGRPGARKPYGLIGASPLSAIDIDKAQHD